MREIDLGTFAAAHAEGALVIDVREPGEYVSGHVPGAKLIPLNRLPEQLVDLPRDERIFLICASGKRSLFGSDFLARAGIDSVSVACGTEGWQRSGRPITVGTRP